MKKLTHRKATVIQATFVAFIVLFASCNYNQKTEDTKDVAEERNEEKFDDNKRQKDAQFLVNAAEMNLEEIQLGQLAQQNGRTSHIKELGKMMEDAHTKSLNDLTALAKSKMITIPTSLTDDSKDSYEELNEESGDDFDKAYADMMVSKHKDAIDAFEEASTDSHDADIRNWAAASLPDLRKHLNHSLDSQDKFDNNKNNN